MENIFSHVRNRPFIIAALRLPPFIGSTTGQGFPLKRIIQFSIDNAAKAVEAGIDAVCIQDIGNYPISNNPIINSITITYMTAIGCALTKEFPDLTLGVSLISPGGSAPIAIASAINAKFVRIKLFVGAATRSEGVVNGCAAEAQETRTKLVASDQIMIFADVHDRDSTPIGNPPLDQSIFDAVVFGQADGVILTGGSMEETIKMVQTASRGKFEVPIIVGGGINKENVNQLRGMADGIFVSKSLWLPSQDQSKKTLWADWDLNAMKDFMQAINQDQHHEQMVNI